MSHESTVTSKGQVTIPKAIRERMGLEAGETVLFRLDDDGGVRMVRVPSDPQARLEAARNRGSTADIDATAALERERQRWS
ncbi:AbrB family transcriptional regulator [Halostagnicola larsenii XH-48]|uniref:AbrB family transcriptional regulator n=1 Tax=Halostagnicola larsenii XH-48 TaxID=797299 RepID=W0JI11_9EURY|nr:AbrB/MazE/SpoVT family DNA-binding domain-containing protein [Halostagnicola larsenii]AHF98345.1 AbrB family transcriptional regulator [Halostagnicola larsenii XH-48]